MGSNTDAALALREGSEAGTQAEEEVEVAKPVAACEGSSVTEAGHIMGWRPSSQQSAQGKDSQPGDGTKQYTTKH